MESSTSKQEFGPYSAPPTIHINYSEKNSLVRTIIEEISEPERVEEEMTFKKWVLYFLFIYNPPKPNKFGKERKVLGKETLAEKVTGFRIVKKNEEYYVSADMN